MSKFLETVKKELNETKVYLKEVNEAIKKGKIIRKQNNLNFREPKFNLYSFLTDCINDKKIDYNISDFYKSMMKLFPRTNALKTVAFDLGKIKDYVNNKQISDDTFIYIILRFYASNYDIIINFFEPLAKKIKSGYNYQLYRKDGGLIKKISNAESVELLFNKHSPKFHKYLLKLCNRNLRNSIAHEDYEIKNGVIYFNKKRISRDSIFKIIVFQGVLISKLQVIYAKYVITTSKLILKNKISKKKLKLYLKTISI